MHVFQIHLVAHPYHKKYRVLRTSIECLGRDMCSNGGMRVRLNEEQGLEHDDYDKACVEPLSNRITLQFW